MQNSVKLKSISNVPWYTIVILALGKPKAGAVPQVQIHSDLNLEFKPREGHILRFCLKK